MKKELTCKEICDKLNISRETIKAYYQLLNIVDVAEVVDSYILNEAQIHILINIQGYEKLGYSQVAILENSDLTSSTQEGIFNSTIKDIIGLVPVVVVSKDENNKIVLKTNSLSPSLDSFLEDSENLSVKNIAHKLIINSVDIARIIEQAKHCRETGEKCQIFVQGAFENRFYYFRVTSFQSDDSFKSKLFTTIFRDYTESYLSQKNITENNVGFHNTLDKIPFPLLILEKDDIIYFNHSVYLQFKKENIIDYSFSSLLYSFSNNPEFVLTVLEDKEKFMQSSQSNLFIEKIEFNIQDKYYIFNLHFSKIDSNKVLVGFSDITEKEEHLGNLMLERNLFENGPVMVMKCINREEKKKTEWISENVKHFTGYTRDEIISRNIDINNLISEDMLPTLYKEADEFYEKKQEFYSHSPYKMIKKDGSEIWVKDHTRLLFDANHNYVGYLEYLIDVSDMKAFEEGLKKAKEEAEEANRAKSTFLSHMSHEIRTPLNAINGFSQLIYDVEKDLDKREKLRTIVQSGNHLLDIINNILELSKIESGNIKLAQAEFSLKSVIDEVQRIISISANSKSLEFTIIKSLIIPDRVVGDEIQLKQILINLLSNAVNYTERGGITLELKYSAGTAIFIVKDTGIGINKQKIESIFNAFEQIRSEQRKITYGTGLGLSIVKKIVTAMQGEIKVESKLNRGSTFEVSIPLPKGKGTSPLLDKMDYEYTAVTDLSKINILVAEDNTINQKLIKSILKKVNNSCDIAEDGKVALEMLEKKDYDILLLDMQMPVMNGMETLQRLRQDEKFKNFPIIALTAYAMSEERDKYIAAGCDEFVAKPINKNELYSKITKLCNR